MPSPRVALGSLLGAAAAAGIALLAKPFFRVPLGGTGFVTVHNYPKGWDYFTVAALILGSFLGGALAARRTQPQPLPTINRPPATGHRPLLLTFVVFVLMLLIHDHPYTLMETFHEGEHLTPASVLKQGGRPYKDIFFLHGLATDGGLDALVLGDPPSPRRARRLQTVLDAATLALLVPIAAEACATGWGMAAGVLASLCATAAFWLPVFPWFRLAPLLIAALALLRYARKGGALALAAAFAAGTLGILWSLDTGTYTLAGVVLVFLLLRVFRLEAVPLPWAQVAIIAAIALVLPFALLLAIRADIARFLSDSFVVIPNAIDAVWSLPAPSAFTLEALHYYLPPVVYGFLLALALRAERATAARIVILAVLSAILFRTAAGRVSWSHTRFSLPLLGILLVAFVLEPLVRAKRWLPAAVLTVLVAFQLELVPNLIAGAKLLAGWRARQSHASLVPYPFATGKGIYTTQQNADELAALNGLLDQAGPNATFLDFSGERALYYLLGRKPPLRCPDIHMLSAYPLLGEAMAELEANPPAFVVLQGTSALSEFDGVPNRDRVPELAQWIDATYPNHVQIGRFTVATRRAFSRGYLDRPPLLPKS